MVFQGGKHADISSFFLPFFLENIIFVREEVFPLQLSSQIYELI